MVWYSYSIEGVLTTITDENLVAFQSAESLEIALVNQKGFVSYYFQDGNPTGWSSWRNTAGCSANSWARHAHWPSLPN
jgi:hypothetical protein